MTYILYAVGFLAFLSLCVYFAIKFNDWSEREADRNEKQAKDLQMALLRANSKLKGTKFSKKLIK